MKYKLLALMIAMVLGFGFQIADTSSLFPRQKVEDYYLEHMTKFHKSQIALCQERAIEIARLQVDSVLTGKKFLVEVDSFLLYPKAKRPKIPTFDYADDSISVDPLFLQDTVK